MRDQKGTKENKQQKRGKVKNKKNTKTTLDKQNSYENKSPRITLPYPEPYLCQTAPCPP